MSLLPKPKKPKSHSNSDIALDDLKKHLPREWNKAKNNDDDDSGYEWGEDWKIEIVENEVVTGAFFSVQSKVLDGKHTINSNGIGTEINVTTINRLFDIPYPVLIHYVHPKTGTSYIMWLDDWMANQSDLSWRTKENGTVTLRIPLLPENKLDSNKVEKIKQHVLTYSLWHSTNKMVELINRTSTDHRLELVETQHGKTIIIHALHENAIPKVMFLDEQAVKSFQKVIDYGLPTPILGKVAFSNIPQLLIEKIKNRRFIADSQVTNTKSLVIYLDLLDKERKSLYKTGQINMQIVQQGRKIIKLQGTSYIDGLILSIELFSEEPNKFDLSFKFLDDCNSPIVTLNSLKFIRALQQAVFADLNELTLNLPLGETAIESLKIDISESIPDFEIELAETLVEIFRKLKLEIKFPDIYTDKDVVAAQIIGQVLKTGRVYGLLDFPISPSGTLEILMYPSAVAEMVGDFEKSWENGDENTLFLPTSTLRFELLEHKIMLGKRKVVLHVLSVDRIGQQVVIQGGEEYIEVHLTFDLSKSFTVYEDWCSHEDKLSYFSP